MVKLGHASGSTPIIVTYGNSNEISNNNDDDDNDEDTIIRTQHNYYNVHKIKNGDGNNNDVDDNNHDYDDD